MVVLKNFEIDSPEGKRNYTNEKCISHCIGNV